MAALFRLPDGLFRIHHQIEQGLLDLRCIGPCLWQPFVEIQFHSNIFQAQFVRTHLQRTLHDSVDVYWTAFALTAAREEQQVSRDAFGTFCLGQDMPAFGFPLKASRPSLHSLRVADNAGERIIQFMCHARDHLPERGQALAME